MQEVYSIISCFYHIGHKQANIKPPIPQRWIYSAQAHFVFWKSDQNGSGLITKSHFTASRVPPSGPKTPHVKSSDLKGELAIILIPLQGKKIMFEEEKSETDSIGTE